MSIERIMTARMETFFVVAVALFVVGQIALLSGSNYNPNDFLGPVCERLMVLVHDGLNVIAGICFFVGAMKLILERWL